MTKKLITRSLYTSISFVAFVLCMTRVVISMVNNVPTEGILTLFASVLLLTNFLGLVQIIAWDIAGKERV